METILIWLGSGFAFGVGLMTGVALIPAMTKKSRDENQQLARESLTELRRRNSIGDRIACALEEIVDVLMTVDGSEDEATDGA